MMTWIIAHDGSLVQVSQIARIRMASTPYARQRGMMHVCTQIAGTSEEDEILLTPPVTKAQADTVMAALRMELPLGTVDIPRLLRLAAGSDPAADAGGTT